MFGVRWWGQAGHPSSFSFKPVVGFEGYLCFLPAVSHSDSSTPTHFRSLSLPPIPSRCTLSHTACHENTLTTTRTHRRCVSAFFGLPFFSFGKGVDLQSVGPRCVFLARGVGVGASYRLSVQPFFTPLACAVWVGFAARHPPLSSCSFRWALTCPVVCII